MTLTRKTQIGLVITALVLFVLLFLAPKTHSEKKSEGKEMISSNENSTIKSFLESSVLALKSDEKSAYELLEKTHDAIMNLPSVRNHLNLQPFPQSEAKQPVNVQTNDTEQMTLIK